jgi:hypothetical protein
MLTAYVYAPVTNLTGMQLLGSVKEVVQELVRAGELKMLTELVSVPVTSLTGMQLLKNVKERAQELVLVEGQ